MTTDRSRRTNSARETLAVPLLVCLAICLGLVSALIGGDAWHVASWILLTIPIVLVAAALLRGRS